MKRIYADKRLIVPWFHSVSELADFCEAFAGAIQERPTVIAESYVASFCVDGEEIAPTLHAIDTYAKVVGGLGTGKCLRWTNLAGLWTQDVEDYWTAKLGHTVDYVYAPYGVDDPRKASRSAQVVKYGQRVCPSGAVTFKVRLEVV